MEAFLFCKLNYLCWFEFVANRNAEMIFESDRWSCRKKMFCKRKGVERNDDKAKKKVRDWWSMFDRNEVELKPCVSLMKVRLIFSWEWIGLLFRHEKRKRKKRKDDVRGRDATLVDVHKQKKRKIFSFLFSSSIDGGKKQRPMDDFVVFPLPLFDFWTSKRICSVWREISSRNCSICSLAICESFSPFHWRIWSPEDEEKNSAIEKKTFFFPRTDSQISVSFGDRTRKNVRNFDDRFSARLVENFRSDRETWRRKVWRKCCSFFPRRRTDFS